MERWCEEVDIATVLALLRSEVAPPEILYALTAFTFLSPLNSFLKRVGCEPKFVLFLVGKTGSRKSTLAALFLSFFGRFTGAELPLSFQDISVITTRRKAQRSPTRTRPGWTSPRKIRLSSRTLMNRSSHRNCGTSCGMYAPISADHPSTWTSRICSRDWSSALTAEKL